MRIVILYTEQCVLKDIVNHALIQEVATLHAFTHKRNPFMADIRRVDIDENVKL